MKINELNRGTYSSLLSKDGDLIINSEANGTQKINVNELEYLIFDSNPIMHRHIWRGKNLGNHLTDEQYQNIRTGDFHNLWIGDYWEINNIKYRIVDFDYFNIYQMTDHPRITTHTAQIMPDTVLTKNPMHNTSSNSQGYLNSSYITQTHSSMETNLKSIFNNHLLPFTSQVVSSMHNNVPTGLTLVWWWSRLPSLEMLTGTYPNGWDWNSTQQWGPPYMEASPQLSAFRLNKDITNCSDSYWLSSPVGGYEFHYYNVDDGTFNYKYANQECGWRPIFQIG